MKKSNAGLGTNWCFTGVLRTGGDPNWSGVISDGTACRWQHAQPAEI